MKRNLLVTTVVAVLMAGFVLIYTALTPAQAQPSMGGSVTGTGGTVPGVTGYADGREIRFVHTETSSPKIARILTGMTRSRVLVVPSLAQAPTPMLADVYVFTNGIKDGGPLGFQPDVFDKPPGTSGYRPLRELNLVIWKVGHRARVVQSAAEVKMAVERGEVTVQRTGVVMNMPILSWPGGQR
jgi:hypothetical protein